MNIDIANMALTIGEKTEGIDWGEAVVTLGSVFLGAYFAYRFGMKQNTHKKKEQRLTEYSFIAMQIAYLLGKALDFKKNSLDKIKQQIDDGTITTAGLSHLAPDVKFDIPLERYFFLSEYNIAFISELDNIRTSGNYLIKVWETYVNVAQNELEKISHPKLFEVSLKSIKETFYNYYNTYLIYCIKLYYITKQFNKCYDKYFNISYLNNIQENFKKQIDIEKDIPNALQRKEFIEWEEAFDKGWVQPVNIWCLLCFYYRKIKYLIKKFKCFFVKTMKCENCIVHQVMKKKK